MMRRRARRESEAGVVDGGDGARRPARRRAGRRLPRRRTPARADPSRGRFLKTGDSSSSFCPRRRSESRTPSPRRTPSPLWVGVRLGSRFGERLVVNVMSAAAAAECESAASFCGGFDRRSRIVLIRRSEFGPPRDTRRRADHHDVRHELIAVVLELGRLGELRAVAVAAHRGDVLCAPATAATKPRRRAWRGCPACSAANRTGRCSAARGELFGFGGPASSGSCERETGGRRLACDPGREPGRGPARPRDVSRFLDVSRIRAQNIANRASRPRRFRVLSVIRDALVQVVRRGRLRLKILRLGVRERVRRARRVNLRPSATRFAARRRGVYGGPAVSVERPSPFRARVTRARAVAAVPPAPPPGAAAAVPGVDGAVPAVPPRARGRVRLREVPAAVLVAAVRVAVRRGGCPTPGTSPGWAPARLAYSDEYTLAPASAAPSRLPARNTPARASVPPLSPEPLMSAPGARR